MKSRYWLLLPALALSQAVHAADSTRNNGVRLSLFTLCEADWSGRLRGYRCYAAQQRDLTLRCVSARHDERLMPAESGRPTRRSMARTRSGTS